MWVSLQNTKHAIINNIKNFEAQVNWNKDTSIIIIIIVYNDMSKWR